jgi:hypothetical protein
MLEDDASFNTATMADIFARQGYLAKAAKIYHSLLGKGLDTADQAMISQKLLQIRQQLRVKQTQSHRLLRPLLCQWVELVLQVDRIERLKRLQGQGRSVETPSSQP